MNTSPNLSSRFSGISTVRQTLAATSPPKGVSLTLKMAQSKMSGDAQKELIKLGQHRYCPCCYKRHFLGDMLGKGLLPVSPSFASDGEDSTPQDDPMERVNLFYRKRPDWYEELFALFLDRFMKPYEAEIAGYKSQLLGELRGKAEKVLEIGIGTGPNLKYYANDPSINVVGIDPNKKMEKYAKAAAEAAGLSPSNFTFLQGVGEALPLTDSSVDAVVGTLVLCSVKNVDQTLQEIKRVLKPGGRYIFIEHVAAKDGSLRRLVQGIVNPLQQAIFDGCHLTRDTAGSIENAGFANIDVNEIVLSTALFAIANPVVYGMANR